MTTSDDWIATFLAGLAENSALPVPDVDWPGVEARLGHPLPRDYKDFIARVGPGAFEGEISILHPDHHSYRSLIGNIGRHLSSSGRIDWGRRCFFMVDGNGNEIAWRMDGPDPGVWPVEIFVHEEENAPQIWATGFRDLVTRMGSAAGIHHPGYEANDQWLMRGPKHYGQ